MPEGEEPDGYKETVFEQLDQLIRVGKEQDVILLHENEKDIYGDSIMRCEKLMKEFMAIILRQYLILPTLFSADRIHGMHTA